MARVPHPTGGLAPSSGMPWEQGSRQGARAAVKRHRREGHGRGRHHKIDSLAVDEARDAHDGYAEAQTQGAVVMLEHTLYPISAKSVRQ